MKLEHIIEARYYRKHSVEDVYKRIKHKSSHVHKSSLAQGIDTPHYFQGHRRHHSGVKANVFVSADSEQKAVNQVLALLKSHGIPFTEIGDVVHLGYGPAGKTQWRATMWYTSGLTSDNLSEARYYRQPTLKQIEKRLQELSHETKRDDIYVYDQAVVNNSVHADFYVYGIEEHDDVVEAIKRFLIKQGIPFTRIWNVINTTYRNTGFKYTATMTYNPKIPVTEARYQPHGEISRRYSVYDPRTGLYPYSVMSLGMKRPKTSDTFNTADEAHERIKELHDQAVQYQQDNPRTHQHGDVAFTKKIQAAIEATRYYRVVEMIARYTK